MNPEPTEEGPPTFEEMKEELTREVLQKPIEAYLQACAQNRELVAQYDRLRGTNLQGKGLSPIDRMIDEATSNGEEQWMEFFAFCMDQLLRVRPTKKEGA